MFFGRESLNYNLDQKNLDRKVKPMLIIGENANTEDSTSFSWSLKPIFLPIKQPMQITLDTVKEYRVYFLKSDFMILEVNSRVCEQD